MLSRLSFRSYFAISELQEHEFILASQSVASWNRIVGWLNEMNVLRQTARLLKVTLDRPVLKAVHTS